MKDFEMRYVGSHVEVYTGSGVFLFSADTVREAMDDKTVFNVSELKNIGAMNATDVLKYAPKVIRTVS